MDDDYELVTPHDTDKLILWFFGIIVAIVVIGAHVDLPFIRPAPDWLGNLASGMVGSMATYLTMKKAAQAAAKAAGIAAAAALPTDPVPVVIEQPESEPVPVESK